MTVSYALSRGDTNIPEDFPWSTVFKISKLCVIAKDDGKFAGACGFRGMFNILSVYVAPEYRNRGMGTSLLTNLIISAKEENCRFITLAVGWGTRNNIPARNLFEQHGFRKVVDIERQTIMILPLGGIIGVLIYFSAHRSFSLIPTTLLKRIVASASKLSF